MIKRIFLIVFLHVLVIFFLLTTHPQAKEDGWTIEDHGTYIVTSVPGEVTNFLNVDFTGFGGPARTRTWDQYIMSVLL